MVVHGDQSSVKLPDLTLRSFESLKLQRFPIADQKKQTAQGCEAGEASARNPFTEDRCGSVGSLQEQAGSSCTSELNLSHTLNARAPARIFHRTPWWCRHLTVGSHCHRGTCSDWNFRESSTAHLGPSSSWTINPEDARPYLKMYFQQDSSSKHTHVGKQVETGNAQLSLLKDTNTMHKIPDSTQKS